jgi:hypothetical protein
MSPTNASVTALRYPVLSLAMDSDARDDPARLAPGATFVPVARQPPALQHEAAVVVPPQVGLEFLLSLASLDLVFVSFVKLQDLWNAICNGGSVPASVCLTQCQGAHIELQSVQHRVPDPSGSRQA